MTIGRALGSTLVKAGAGGFNSVTKRHINGHSQTYVFNDAITRETT